MHAGRGKAGDLVRRLRAAVADPRLTTDLLQIAKTVIAATAAWWVTLRLLGSEQAFLAPWTALLTVHATVYRSATRGLETVAASGVGVLLSFLVGEYLGVSAWTLALAIFIGMLASRLGLLRHEGVAVATTAIFVLATGYTDQRLLLWERLAEVALGVAIGLLVNLLILPPLRDNQAAAYVDRANGTMSEVMREVADALDGSPTTEQADEWIEQTHGINLELGEASSVVQYARESRWWNPRARRRPAPRVLSHADSATRVGYEDILARMEEGAAELGHIARTIRESSATGQVWEAEFRVRWVAILRDAADAVADPDATVEPVRDRLDALADDLSSEDLPQRLWPTYGSLIDGLRHIATIVDDVASAREAREADRPNPAG